MIGRLRTSTLKSLMAVMAVGVLLHAQAAVACAMPDPEPSMPCCIEHCDEAIAESNGCAEPVLSTIVVDVRGPDDRSGNGRGPTTGDGPAAGLPSAYWAMLDRQRPPPERFTDSNPPDGADRAVYLATRRIRI